MSIHVIPDKGIPIPPVVPYVDLRKRASAACDTANLLQAHGLVIEEDDFTNQIAASLSLAYAADPEKTSKTVNHTRTASLPPASVVKINDILNEFGTLVAREAEAVRNLVVNKLLLETENPDGKIRMKSLELLGKMTGIDLFTDRKEVTITHQSPDELREKLREKLEKLRALEHDPVLDAQFEPLPIIGGEEIDVDAELGMVK